MQITKKPEVVIIMGYPAAGKTTETEKYVSAGYTRINRDEIGGKLKDLIQYLEQGYENGQRSFVLDNTYPTAESRAPLIKWAKQKEIPVVCDHLLTNIDEAFYNLALRTLNQLGHLPSIEEMKKHNIVPPAALFSYRKKFEKPSNDEGFHTIKRIGFERRRNPGVYMHKAVLCDYDGTLRTTTGKHYTGTKRKKLVEYPYEPSEVKILPNRAKVLKHYQDMGYYILGISNQSGIGKGEITEKQALACIEKTNELLGVKIDYQICPHYSFPVKCLCHKPQTGIGVYFIEKYKLDPAQCIMVGDLPKDEQFAHALGFQYHDAKVFFENHTLPF